MTTAFTHRETGAPLRVDGQEVAYWLVNAHTALLNYTGHPASVLPYRLDGEGLPIGVQLVGKRWGERVCWRSPRRYRRRRASLEGRRGLSSCQLSVVGSQFLRDPVAHHAQRGRL
jgi:Asp-tRNA(Asn)/Glu-tRNA(Gln) amidotransferase A subunit family amidase